jgi:hypothetical protein
VNKSQSRSAETGGDTATPSGGVTVLRDRLESASREPEALDLVHDVLSNRRRRQILHLLEADPDGSATVPELASTIAAWEMDIDDPETVSYDDRKSVQATIYQHHAPKMAAAGLVEFDKRAGRVELDRQATDVGLADDDNDAASDEETDDAEPAVQPWRQPAAAAAAGIAASIVSIAATAAIAGPAMGVAVLGVCVTTAFVTWRHSDL